MKIEFDKLMLMNAQCCLCTCNANAKCMLNTRVLHDRLEVAPEGVPKGRYQLSARRWHVDVASGSVTT